MGLPLASTTKRRRNRAGMPNGKTALRGTSRSIRRLFVAVVLTPLAAGCGAAADVGDSLLGRIDDPDVVTTVLVDPEERPLADTLDLTESVVARSADSGQRLSAYVLAGGNASTARAVDLAKANDGDLRLRARNDSGRQKEAEQNTRAVMTAIGAELTALANANPAGGDTGNDLFGAIRRAAMSPVTPDRVILITGGGLHRTAELDLLEGYRDVPELVRAIPEVRAPDTDLIVLGVADFSGAETTPSIAFTDAVTELWEAACEIWLLRSCTLATDPAVLDELQVDPESSVPAGPALAAGLASAAGLAMAAGLALAMSLALAPRLAAKARRIAIAAIVLAVCLILVGCGADGAGESGEGTPEAGTSEIVSGGASLPAAETLDGEIPGIEAFVPARDDPGLEAEPSPSGAPAPADASEALAPPAPSRSGESQAAGPPPSEPPAAEPPAPEPPAPEPPAAEPPADAPTPPPLPDPEPATSGDAVSPAPEPADEPLEPPRLACQGFRVGDVLFESGTATLAGTAADSLKALVQQIPGGVEIRIVGHTDDVPISMGNDSLSELRAHAVARGLIEAGLDPADISEIVGKGDSEPVAGNDSTEGRRRNRRVEVVVSCPAEPEGASMGALSPAVSACASSFDCRTEVNPDGVWLAFIFPWRRFLSRRPHRGSKPAMPVRRLPALEPPTCPDGQARMTFLQVVAAALNGPWQRLRGARANLGQQLAHLQLAVAHGERAVERSRDRLVAALEAAKGQRPPQRSARFTGLITVALLVGDIAVTSSALLVHDPTTAPLEGYITSLAIAITLVALGYMLGEQLHPERRNRRLLRPLLFVLGVTGVFLYLLRQDVGIGWILLSILPAFGAAAVKATGRSAEQREVVQRERALRRDESRLEQARARVDRTMGKARELEEISSIMFMRALLEAKSQLMPYGLDDPFPSVAEMIDETEVLERLEQMAADPGGEPAGFDRTTVDMVNQAIRVALRSAVKDAASGDEVDAEPASNGSGQPQPHGSPDDRAGTTDGASGSGPKCRVCGRRH